MKPKNLIFRETTQVPAERTAAEIVTELVKAGASQVNTEYANGDIVGLRWIMRIDGVDRLFTMPARVEPVYKLMEKRAKEHAVYSWGKPQQIAELKAKARRVAWRQLLAWIQAQLAMTECGMADRLEVFFAYVNSNEGQTLFDVFRGGGLKALPPAGKTQ